MVRNMVKKMSMKEIMKLLDEMGDAQILRGETYRKYLEAIPLRQ